MQIKLIISLLTLTSVALFSATSLQADTLANWGMTSTSPSVMITPTTVDTAAVSVGNLAGVNLNSPVNMSPHGSSTNNYLGWSRSSSTGGASGDLALSQVLADATYFTFTITPNAGQMITINNLYFACMLGTSTATANREFFLFAGPTGYTESDVLLAGGSQASIGGYTFTTPQIPLNNSTTGDTFYSVDLSGNGAFANLTGPVTFRIYIGTDTVSQNVGFTQLTVEGLAQPIPEPSSIACLCAGGLVLLATGRFRRQK